MKEPCPMMINSTGPRRPDRRRGESAVKNLKHPTVLRPEEGRGVPFTSQSGFFYFQSVRAGNNGFGDVAFVRGFPRDRQRLAVDGDLCHVPDFSER